MHGDDASNWGQGWENSFTEAVAFYLRCDRQALMGLCGTLLPEAVPEPTDVTTQVRAVGGTPDLCIQLRTGGYLLIECKVDAALGPSQLERYLALGHFVALFAKRDVTVSRCVLSKDRYRHPPDRQHYTWQDLFRLIPERPPADPGLSSLRREFADYLGYLGFEPTTLPAEWTRLFEDRTSSDNRRVQEEFGRRLSGVKAFLRDAGFTVTGVSHSGLQARPGRPRPYLFLRVRPARIDRGHFDAEAGARLRPEALSVELIYEGFPPPEACRRLAAAVGAGFVDGAGREWFTGRPYETTNGRTRLQLVTNLTPFVEDDRHGETRLADSCLSAIERILAADSSVGKRSPTARS